MIALEGEGWAGVDADQGVVFGASLRCVAFSCVPELGLKKVILCPGAVAISQSIICKPL